MSRPSWIAAHRRIGPILTLACVGLVGGRAIPTRAQTEGTEAPAEAPVDGAVDDAGALDTTPPEAAEPTTDEVAESDGAPTDADVEPDDEPDLFESMTAEEGDVITATAITTVGASAAGANAASDFEVEPARFRIVPRRTSEQLLTLAPGIVLANHGGIGHSPTVYLRGFDAGEGQDIAYDVDGILINEPSNPHGHGYADIGFVPVEVVRRVLVREGPFDPRQPSYSVAGSVHLELGVERRGLRTSLRYGSFRTVRALAIYAPTGETDGTFVAADVVRGDGFGVNRAHSSVRLIGRLERTVRDLRFTFLAGSHAQRFDSAGVVPLAASRAGNLPCGPSRDAQFFCTVDPNQGGSGQRHLVLGRLGFDRDRASFEQTVYGMARSSRFLDDFTGVALNPVGDGLDQDYRAGTVGMRGAYRRRVSFLGADQRFEFGYLGRYDQGRTSMDRVRFADGVPYARVFDSSLRITEIGIHGLADLSLGRFVSLQGGLRLEAFGASVTHHGLPSSDRDGPRLTSQRVDAFGVAVSPRGTLTLHPVRGLDVVLAAGLGTRPVDVQGLSDGEQVPFTRVTALEFGLMHSGSRDHVEWRARTSVFATRVADDLVFDAERGRNVPVGETRRYGAMATLSGSAFHKVELQGSFTWSEAHLPIPGSPIVELSSGPRVAFVPRFVGRVDLAYRDSFGHGRRAVGVSAGAGLTTVGRKPLPYDELSSRLAVIDAGVEVSYRFVALELLVENLFDARYRNYELQAIADFSAVDGSPPGTMTASRLYAAGAPRTIFATVTFAVDPLPTNQGDR